MQQLGLITTSDNEKIWIDDSGESPILKYKNNEGRVVSITNKNTAAKLSDLEYALRKRDWNIDKRPIVVDDDYCYRKSSKDLSPVADFTTEIVEYKSGSNKDFIKINNEISQESKDLIDEMFRHLVKNDDIPKVEGDDIYKNGNPINFCKDLNENNVINILDLDSFMYTNIVNLNKYLKDSTDEDIIKFGVSWTSVTNKGEVLSYSKDFTLSPLEIELTDNSSKYIKPNIIIEEDDIIVEYIDGCIRAFTKSRNVKECIISYCYLING